MSRYLKFLEQDPQNLNLLLAIVTEFRESGHLTEALQFLEQALSLAKTKANDETFLGELYALKAQLYFDKDDPERAEQTAQHTLQLDPDNYSAQVTLLLLDLAEGKTSISQVKKLMKREPKDCRLWFALGNLYFQALKFQQAEEAHRKAAELEPGFYENWVSLAWSQLFLDKLSDAKTSYQEAIALDEEGAEPWGGLALANALNAELSKATALIEKAKDLDPECFLAAVAELIVANQQNPQKAVSTFNLCMPKASQQITEAMNMLFQAMDTNL